MLFGSSQGMWVYIPCLFSISPEPISNTRILGECHGTAAYEAQTTSIYDVIGHR
jgi:hypothetical protein